MESLELKNIIIEIKNPMDGLSSSMKKKRKESVNWKVNN